MKSRSFVYYLALGFLILGIFMGEVEARRKILRGRKTLTRTYFRISEFKRYSAIFVGIFVVAFEILHKKGGLGIPAWSIVVLCGLGMLAVGGGLYALLRKLVISDSGENDTRSYHPAMQNEA